MKIYLHRLPRIMAENNKKLISIDEVVALAKKMGVDFGNGNVRHRLRYYTKIGILPHAQRKSFNNNHPEGAYDESVIDLIVDIDKKIKAGKSIQAIKREIEKEEESREKIKERLFENSFIPSLPRDIYNAPEEKISETKEEFLFEEKPEVSSGILRETGKENLFPLAPRPSKLNFVFKILLIILISASAVFFIKAKPDIQKLTSFLSAGLTKGEELLSSLSSANTWIFKKLSQAPSSLEKQIPPAVVSEPDYEPYLTINAETLINGSLKVKDEISAPVLGLTKDGFEGRLTAADLTDNRSYVFPDESGTVCLTTGNCIGLSGGLTSVGSSPNRLARFISAGQLGNASISDFYEGGVVITIDELGRVGIGTNVPRAKLEVAGDFLTPNIFVSGQTNGNVGIKTDDPKYDLHVQGRIQATGDICTDVGGKCLSQLSQGGVVFFGGGGGTTVSGISGSGSTNYLPVWTSSSALGNSIASQSGSLLSVAGTVSMTGFQLATTTASGYVLTSDGSGVGTWQAAAGGVSGSGSANRAAFWSATSALSYDDAFTWDNTSKRLGIGTTSPASMLQVYGRIRMNEFQLGDSATSSYVLTADASGVGTWQALPEGTLPSGSSGYTLRHNGTNWIANSFLYNTGSAIGIGTTSTTAVLTVSGGGYFSGPLTLATSTLPQLVLNYDDDNYLKFSIDTASSTILASKTMILNSLTGEIQLGGDVTLLNATSASVWGETFVSSANDATVRKSGELILRSSVPVFKFPVPAQTTSTAAVAVSKEIATSTLNAALPSTIAGTTRYFAFLLNFSDDISTSASSTWVIDLTAGTDTEFYFAGQELSGDGMEEGVSHMSSLYSLPEENWQLKVSVPAGKSIRVFNVFLLIFDRVN